MYLIHTIEYKIEDTADTRKEDAENEYIYASIIQFKLLNCSHPTVLFIFYLNVHALKAFRRRK